jgi:anti-anti-sigma factor
VSSDLFGQRLNILHERRGGETRMALQGELDVGNTPELERALLEVENSDAHIIRLDLSELDFLDSTGLRVILSAQLRQLEGDRLRLIPGPERVQRVFVMTGTAELLHFEDGGEPPDNVHELRRQQPG